MLCATPAGGARRLTQQVAVRENGRSRAGGRIPLLALLAANAVSELGNVVASVAIPWFVLQTTGSAIKMGLVAGSMVLAFVVAGFFGGPLVDRVGLKNASVMADIASGATVAGIPLLYVTVGLSYWQLLVLAFTGALLDAPGKTARRGLVPQLAESTGTRLEQANSFYQSAARLAQLLGPIMGGVLIAAVGAHNALFFDAATFAMSAVVVSVAVPASRRDDGPETEPANSTAGYFGELVEGLRFMRRDTLVLSVVIVYTVTEFLDAPLAPVILPFYADSVYGSAAKLGVMVGILGAGALIGSLFFGAVGSRLRRGRLFIWAMIALQLPFWALATTPTLLVALPALFVTGLAAGLLNVLLHTVIQERIPHDMLGRVLGAFFAVGMAAVPLGMTLAGWLLQTTSLRYTLIVLAVCYAAVTFGLTLNPLLRKMNVPQKSEDQDISPGDLQ